MEKMIRRGERMISVISLALPLIVLALQCVFIVTRLGTGGYALWFMAAIALTGILGWASFLLILRRRYSLMSHEMSALVLGEAEKARLTKLGVHAGSLAHDMGSPIHTIYNIAQALINDPKLRGNDKYFDYLMRNADRCRQLVNSVQSTLRRSPLHDESFTFGEVHESVCSILRAQYGETRLRALSFEVDAKLRDRQFALPRPEFTQIFDNIYRNCLDDMVKGQRSEGRVTLSLVEDGACTPGFLQIDIHDNSNALTAERFEQLTAFGHNSVQALLSPEAEGLGLRLMRRLVEAMEGDLRVLPQSGEAVGTHFRLKLKDTRAAQ